MAEQKILVSPIGRVSYPKVWEMAKRAPDSDAMAFQITLIFSEDHFNTEAEKQQYREDMARLQAEIRRAVSAKWPEGPPKGKKLRSPLKPNDEQNDDAYAVQGVHAAFRQDKASSIRVIDGKTRPITKQSGLFYAGCFARVSFNAWAYVHAMGNGVSLTFYSVQKVRDGEPLAVNADRLVDDSVSQFGEIEGYAEDVEPMDVGSEVADMGDLFD